MTAKHSETDLPFAMYDAFAEFPYSGSQAAIVLNASTITHQNRARIAREIGVPATSFVDGVQGNRITLQFYSTVMELPMCGHGTICLITRLVDAGLLPCEGDAWHDAILDLPKGEAFVGYRQNAAGRIEVMLDVTPASYTLARLDLDRLTGLLGIAPADLSTDLPVEVASADFIHLCLPLKNLNAMAALNPNFSALAAFCVAEGIETVAAFSTKVTDSRQNLHVRDFCPAVGVAESAAAGTTNAALAGYLWRNGVVAPDAAGVVTVLAEQGIELGRPSQITSLITLRDGQIDRLQVGGIATRVTEGVLNTAFGAG